MTKYMALFVAPALMALLMACQPQNSALANGTPEQETQPMQTEQEKTQEKKEEAKKEAFVKLSIRNKGEVILQIDLQEAPQTGANFLKLVQEHFYDGIVFHRVVPKFVAQAGDPLTKTLPLDDPRIGTGGPGYNVKFEPNKLKHKRGSLGLARAQALDSGGSQFYICLEDLPQLDGNYVVFGKVVKGMEIVDRIVRGDVIEKAEIIENPDAPKSKPSEGKDQE
ncbi:MAG: peptidylprolyl isomerase [Fimbriimonadales bacterium]